MKKKSMAISTTFYMIIMLALLLVLTFIYFGGTGFFQKIYKLTDKLGLTKLAKDVEEKEKNITESREKLSPEEQRAEEQIKSVVDKIVQGIQSCLAGPNCVCRIDGQQIPEGYVIRFLNAPAEKTVYVSVFRFKERGWYQANYDENYQGQTGVHFVYGTNYNLDNTQSCIVIDLEEHYLDGDDDVDHIQLRDPEAGMIQLFWEGDRYRATESVSPGVVYNSERDYDVYGAGSYSLNSIYKAKDGRFCFFAERFVDEDTDLVDRIVCGKSEEQPS
ncbi:hypothetical protein COV19_06500 [Candidatus Woesearchaeota archaeon CG10_big_fil_rev_8_21_14_0_10_44_13]|nr:MAG: hypothetical protein COV19_06500 [Candidatus Woesearchaeota archaeon CG10_big_fil_rev_8_21_14_0_10_44_13]